MVDYYDNIRVEKVHRYFSKRLGESWNMLHKRLSEIYPAPKRRNTRPKICPVTGNETNGFGNIHVDAWGLMCDGIKFRELIDLEPRQSYIISRRYLAFDEHTAAGSLVMGEQATEGFIGHLASLMGTQFYRVEIRSIAQFQNYQFLIDTDSTRATYYYGLDLTEKQADSVRIMIAVIKRAIESAGQAGFRAGNSWILGLAHGDISATQLNKGLSK